MKKRPTQTAKQAPRSLRHHELRTITGGDGANPPAPATDGGLGQMEQMMQQQMMQQM